MSSNAVSWSNFFFPVGQGKAGWREFWLLMGALVLIQNI
jgi:hypothetical protein